jgi:hypothetical protein
MNEIAHIIGRVRRAMPRNDDVMTLCDELERRLVTRVVTPVVTAVTPKRDRAEYMRQYRAKQSRI